MKNKGIVSVFKLAMINEIYLDEISVSNIEFQKILGFNFIRSNSLIDRVKKYKIFWRLLLGLVIICWPVINIFLSLALFFKSLLLSITTKSPRDLQRDVFLLFSARLLQLGKNLGNNVNRTWISFGITGNGIVDKDKIISIYSLSTIHEVFCAFYLSCISPFIIKGMGKPMFFWVFSYTSFKWFLTFQVLNRLGLKSVCFANHYDRWAVLFDNLDVPEKIMMQHGILSEKVGPPTKLMTVNELYCYNQKEADIFFNSVILTRCHVNFIKLSLELFDIPGNGGTSVLFLSCLPITFEIERECMEKLQDFNLILKPHPVFPIKAFLDLRKDINFNLIEDSTLFPRVDLVVSYKSTLAYEYKSCGIPVIFYEKGDSPESIVKLVRDFSDKNC